MKNTRSSRLILNEMERLESLSGRELQNYISELRDALRREYKALYCRVHRLYSEGQKLSSEVSSEMSSSDKEERSEKENLPPTPPIREKGKKEKTLTYVSVPRSRAHAHTQGLVPSLEEMLSASSSMKVPEWYIRYWHSEMVARDWTAKDGSVISNFNWRVNLCSWYKNASPKEIAQRKSLNAHAPLFVALPTRKTGFSASSAALTRLMATANAASPRRHNCNRALTHQRNAASSPERRWRDEHPQRTVKRKTALA